MHSLGPHLRDSESHGRLAFNADCPICRRERLVGTLPSEPILPRRTQALVASGVLALSAATPGAALAAEPLQEREGTAAPGQIVPGDPAPSPDFDPGGASNDLPFEDQPAVPEPPSPGPAGEDTGTLEQEPASDPGEPIVDGEESGAPTSQDEVAAPVEPVPLSSEPTAPPSELTPNVTVPEPPVGAPSPPPRGERTREPKPKPRSVSPKAEANEPIPQATGGLAGAVTAQPQVSPPVAVVGERAHPGDRSHIVLSGESLWSIADDLLGGDASPSRISREVHKLWELNKERIGTGDPDLLMVGTRLRLR
jgi:hypothetical protein